MGVDKLVTTKVLGPLAASPATQPLVSAVQQAYKKGTSYAARTLVIWWVGVLVLASVIAVWLGARNNLGIAPGGVFQYLGVELILRSPFLLVSAIVMIVGSVQARGLIIRWQVTRCLDGLTTPDNTGHVAPVRAAATPGRAEVWFKASGIVAVVLLLAGGLVWVALFFNAAQIAINDLSPSGKML